MTEPKIIIAIDGYSSSGKSTMARTMARQLGYRYIDTGAMYRAVTLYALRHGLATDGNVDAARLEEALPMIQISFATAGEDGIGHCLLNGEDVEKEIRQHEVSAYVSPVAAIPAVRHFLVAQQQQMGCEKGIVMDGRDIGTTVFPDAEMKVFVQASADVRAMRRYKEKLQRGDKATYEDVLQNILERDHIDSTRAESPLRRAEDAELFDNDYMSVEQQEKWLIEHFRKITGYTGPLPSL